VRLVGILVMGTFLALKSKKKAQYILLAVVVGAAGYNFMPETWHERMATITDYQTDGSAMGRIMPGEWRLIWRCIARSGEASKRSGLQRI
jgi:hypothetical protein